jgi:hypothetical protein
MGHKTLAGALSGRRRLMMPTHEIVAAINLATTLFPHCSHGLVHAILKQEAETAGTHAPSETRVKRLLDQHRASSSKSIGQSARSARRRMSMPVKAAH